MPDVRVLTHLVLHFSPQLSGDDVVCVCELLNKIQVYMLHVTITCDLLLATRFTVSRLCIMYV